MDIRAIALVVLLAGCIVPEPGVRPTAYDFGQLPAPAPGAEAATMPVLEIAEVRAPRHLESTYVYYRLVFSDAQAPRPYVDSRWTMPPSQLIAQRLKSRLSQGAYVLGPEDAHADLELAVELEQFDQVFDTHDASRGVVRLRASLIRDRRLVAQQSFAVERPAASADAAGGVHALTQATDAALESLAIWLEAHSGKP